MRENTKNPFARMPKVAVVKLCWTYQKSRMSRENSGITSMIAQLINMAIVAMMAFSLCACEKHSGQGIDELESDVIELALITEELALGPLQKILDGYFVKSVTFDSKGNAWIGTFQQGIIRYNAEETVYYHSGNSIIPEGYVTYDMAVDKKDNVWIGVSQGLLKYDGHDFTLYNTQNTPMPVNFVDAVEVDSQNNIWFASCNSSQGGLVKYDGTEWTVYTPANSPLPPYTLINSMAIDRSDNVWISNGTQLVKISTNGWEIYSDHELRFKPFIISDIKINSQNCVVGAIDFTYSSAGPLSGSPRIFIFDSENKTTLLGWSLFYSGIQNITIDHNDYVWCFDRRGTCGIWIGGEQGRKIDGKNIYDHGEYTPYLTTIKEAPDYRIWFGAEDGFYIR